MRTQVHDKTDNNNSARTKIDLFKIKFAECFW